MTLQLHHIDLGTDSRSVLSTLFKLLTPHAPYSLQVLGTILNAGPRPSTLQGVDPSKVSLWSTIPLHSVPILTTNVPAPYSIVTFQSHIMRQFCFFCSSESRAPFDPPTEEEESHVQQVFQRLREIASEARPRYDSAVVAFGKPGPRRRIITDPSMIVIGGVHEKWAVILASMSSFQSPNIRYTFPRGAFRDAHGEGANRPTWTVRLEGSFGCDGSNVVEQVLSSEIQASDVPFVRGASSVLRTDAYVLSRAPYSVCIRSREDEERPVACALIHSDGSIGALRVDPKFQRQGLGKLVFQALMEKMDFSKRQIYNRDLVSDDHYRDLGGGALGWNWVDTGADNEAGNRFFTSLQVVGGKESKWMCHWTYMLVDSSGRTSLKK